MHLVLFVWFYSFSPLAFSPVNPAHEPPDNLDVPGGKRGAAKEPSECSQYVVRVFIVQKVNILEGFTHMAEHLFYLFPRCQLLGNGVMEFFPGIGFHGNFINQDRKGMAQVHGGIIRMGGNGYKMLA